MGVLGLDDPCPCQSGRTLGDCCVRSGRATIRNGVPIIKMPAPPPEHIAFLNSELQREERFGLIRPAIHVDYRGQKMVVVGREILNSPSWKTPLDFLSDYLKHVMTPAWCQVELSKPLSERHPIMQWYDGTCRLQARAKQHAGPDGVYGVTPSGAMRAYALLAYDLYILQHHRLLEPRMLQRLRNKDQYQGARHELFAAATCVRAGFDIKYEDESDGSSKHTEFIVTHRHTGAKFCSEAKSKHRAGVLGMDGVRLPDDAMRTDLRRLIRDAVSKPRGHPLVLFLDLNLPQTHADPRTREWYETIADPILRGIDRKGEEDPWDVIVFSNQPDHYATDDGPAAGGYASGMFGKNARIGSAPPSELVALVEAADKFGALPNTFEEM